jgi:hypothetical protein
MWFKKYTGKKLEVEKHDIFYEENPFRKEEKVVIRYRIAPKLDSCTSVLGELVSERTGLRLAGIIKFPIFWPIDFATYKEFTPEYSERIKKKLKEIRIGNFLSFVLVGNK